ncbi:MAG: thioredoxin family protein [Parachlamydiaceae bacterium]|nr:thioredoxin family protein [Parachlamydiaceae bacterium]
MFNKLTALLTAILLQSWFLCSADVQSMQSKGSIKWFTNYEEAVQQARSRSLPLIMFFTGSDWCSWCNKIDEEAFDTRDFADAAGNKFVFLKLDLPLYSPQDPQIKAQNKQLQQKFNVRSFPTVIVYDAQQNQQIGTTGYRAGGGKQYAAYLNKMISDYSGYKQKMGAIDNVKPSGIELKQLYCQAKELGLNNDVNKIIKLGMVSNQSLFFQTERYRFLATEGQIHGQEAAALKQQLLAADANNEQQIPYHVAVIEFESICEGMSKENCTTELAIAPLVAYIEKFGTKDKENLWRIQMIISQVYLDKNQMSEALKYAQKSYDSAPASVQADIAVTIQNIKTLTSTTPSAAISKK